MEPRSSLLFPLLVVAAVSVAVFCGIGVAAITGHLTLSHSRTNPDGEFSFPISKAAAASKAKGGQPLPLGASPGANQCQACGKVQSIEAMTVDALVAASGGPLVMRDPNGSTAGNLTAPDTHKATSGYVMRLRMDDGSTRVVQEHGGPDFSVGQRVRLMNGLVLAQN